MNIFVLSLDPRKCAEYHCDKHVVKMILETAQLLSTAHNFNNPKHGKPIYKTSHVNHPCSIWVRRSISNYNWTRELFLALLFEYTYRYRRIHKSSELIPYLLDPPVCKELFETPRPQAMPEIYRDTNVVTAYRNYYIGDKRPLAVWTRRRIPEWYQ